ncbi:MAG: hypothetical protein ACE5NJ_02405, partial [Thermodesulfobacteriota bacterium]
MKPKGLTENSPALSETSQRASQAYYHYILAQLKGHEGNLEETIDELREALSNDPTSAFLHVELARLYIKK